MLASRRDAAPPCGVPRVLPFLQPRAATQCPKYRTLLRTPEGPHNSASRCLLMGFTAAQAPCRPVLEGGGLVRAGFRGVMRGVVPDRVRSGTTTREPATHDRRVAAVLTSPFRYWLAPGSRQITRGCDEGGVGAELAREARAPPAAERMQARAKRSGRPRTRGERRQDVRLARRSREDYRTSAACASPRP